MDESPADAQGSESAPQGLVEKTQLLDVLDVSRSLTVTVL